MFKTIEYLRNGNEKQRRAYDVINKIGVMKDLLSYTPILCGTIPIQIDLEDSDLDIIMDVKDFHDWKNTITQLYSKQLNFNLKEKIIRNQPTIKANFIYEGFEFELFGQSKAVDHQYAYIHMLIEHEVMLRNPSMREKIIALKKLGYKTEPAFCKLLQLEGDPYESLIEYGREKGIIT
ncbi:MULTISPECIES: DUF4269 domain-containing protein [Bacillus]|uniref:DUF4269 domain-containing protein n=1 Tax=Bacillus TaxID=1386 RepID=UPI0003069B9F|nr:MULTISPECIES: DUF4269 domain-containing protein [Bacillus]